MIEADGPSRILVVDDNGDNRDMLARRLQRLGHQTVLAQDGVEALETLHAAEDADRPFDVVMLDVMMPRMNGVEALAAMKADRRLARCRVIMISAATEIETVVRCIGLGAEDYLPKPFNPVLLRARLDAVLQKKRLEDALARQLARFEAELAEARAQQLSMVPDVFPVRGSDGDDVAVHAVMQPAREVGGDLYDVFPCGPGLLCLAIGDVSDKGVPAALFMARTRSLLRGAALQHLDLAGTAPTPARLAAALNDELCKNNPNGMFVSLMLGFLDTKTGRLAFVNAGHPRPLRLGPDGTVEEVITPPGPPLGIAPGHAWRDHEMVLERGTALVALTDGATDMLDPDGNDYGAHRIIADLGSLAMATPERITETLLGRIQAFAGPRAPADDVTILAIRRH